MKHEMMNAVIYERYGGPEAFNVVEVDKHLPAMNEVLVRAHATTVTSIDRRIRSMDMPYGFGLIAQFLELPSPEIELWEVNSRVKPSR